MTNHPTIHSIQYLRAIAVIMVVFHHELIQIETYAKALGDINFGAAGVDIFFVISGFVIWFVTHDRKVGVWEFLKKRFVRVVPMYWLVTLTIVVMTAIAPQFFRSTSFDAIQVIQSLLFIPYYSNSHPGLIWPILVPGWTLNYEIFFYMLFGLFLVFPRNIHWKILFLFLNLVLLGLVFDVNSALFQTYTNPLLLEFVAGVFIGKAYTDGRIKGFSGKFGFLLIIMGFLILSVLDNLKLYVGLSAVLIVLGSLIVETARNLPRLRLLHLLGDASYSIYLTHILALGIYREIWYQLAFVEISFLQIILFIIGGLIFTMACGVIFHLVIERPLLKYLSNKFTKKRGCLEQR